MSLILASINILRGQLQDGTVSNSAILVNILTRHGTITNHATFAHVGI